MGVGGLIVAIIGIITSMIAMYALSQKAGDDAAIHAYQLDNNNFSMNILFPIVIIVVSIIAYTGICYVFGFDYIAGAVRISVSEVDEASGNETLRIVWAPNASTELIPPTPEDRTRTQTGWSIDTDSANVEDYQYYSGTEQLGVGEGELAGLFKSSADAVNPTDMPVASLLMDNELGTYSAHIKIRIWAEGTDREAKYPLAGGKFETTLCFTSMPTETDAEDTTSQQGGQGNG